MTVFKVKKKKAFSFQKRTFFLLGGILLGGALSGMLLKGIYEDLRLGAAVLKKELLPEWEFGSVETVRRIGKDLWGIRAQKLVRGAASDVMHDIRADVTGPSGPRTVISDEGEYSAEKGTLKLTQAHGTWLKGETLFSWKTPEAQWDSRGDQWHFPRGVVIESDQYTLECEKAAMTGETLFHAENGTIGWWTD